MKRYGLYAAIALLLLVNGFILIQSAWNRMGEPDARITLTGRELEVPRNYLLSDSENTGLDIRLKFLTLNYPNDWFDQSKLEELGFVLPYPLEAPQTFRRFNHRSLPREAYVVLEYEGDAWDAFRQGCEDEIEKIRRDAQTEIISRERAKNRIREKQDQLKTSTRLFDVDMGLDPDELRERYPDRSRYIITPSHYNITLDTIWNEDTREFHTVAVRGFIRQSSVSRIHVPRRFQDILKQKQADGSGYSVTINYGKRYEPWIESIEENFTELSIPGG